MTDFTIPRHTPGPWRVYNVQTDPFARIGTYRHAICTIAPSGNVYADAANARLIAAAPELLAALKYAVGQYGKPGGPWNVPDDPGGWLERARAAIAKAEGTGQ